MQKPKISTFSGYLMWIIVLFQIFDAFVQNVP